MSWTIRRLLVVILVVVNALSVGLIIAGIALISDVRQAQDGLRDHLALSDALRNAEVAQRDAAGATGVVIFVNMPDLTKQRDAAITALRKAAKELSAAPMDDEERKPVDAYVEALGSLATMLGGVTPPPPGRMVDFDALTKDMSGYQTVVGAAAKADGEVRTLIENDLAERRAQVSTSSNRLAILLFAAVLALGTGPSIGFAWFGTRLVRRLGKVGDVVQRAQAGDLTARTDLPGGDEIAQAGRGVDGMLARFATVFERMHAMSGDLGTSAEQLRAVAAVVDRTAGEASAQAELVARSADEVSRSVDSVASGTESMSSAISEIAGNAQEAAQTAGGAVSAVEDTTISMSRLSDSSREIGDVIRLITTIAEQTNLLALNATIEAARAGEAGKGFAVVADEVKQLAQETARATEDISRKVEAIQSDANEAGQSIAAVAGVIERIAQYQTTIAGAVEEQTATTMEMNRGVGDAAQGTRAIADSISGLAETAGQTRSAVGDTLDSAGRMQEISTELAQFVSAFRY